MPGPIYSKIKAGEEIKLSDGSIVKLLIFILLFDLFFINKTQLYQLDSAKYVGPSRPGKKITILGDCCGVSNNLIEAAKNSDILIHESTLEDAFQEKAISFGHSTPSNI